LVQLTRIPELLDAAEFRLGVALQECFVAVESPCAIDFNQRAERTCAAAGLVDLAFPVFQLRTQPLHEWHERGLRIHLMGPGVGEYQAHLKSTRHAPVKPLRLLQISDNREPAREVSRLVSL